MSFICWIIGCILVVVVFLLVMVVCVVGDMGMQDFGQCIGISVCICIIDSGVIGGGDFFGMISSYVSDVLVSVSSGSSGSGDGDWFGLLLVSLGD